MAIGLPGADSLTLVTSEIDGQTLVALATALFGRPPALWGRYFTSPHTAKGGEYRHRLENRLLRDNNIRVLPIARQTNRVHGSEAEGSADARANVDDLFATFGADYLASQGREVVMFLDVEPENPLSLAYYRGWATTLVAHSRDASDNR